MLYKNSTDPYNLRCIIVPGNLTKRFLEHAQSNTFNNLETCGILAGKLVIILYFLCQYYSFIVLTKYFIIIVIRVLTV